MFLLIVVGLLAGIVTSLSPCVLPVLPIVLAAGVPRSAASIAAEPGASGVVVAVDPRDGPTRSRSWRPYGVVAGLVISFSASTLFGSLVLGALHLPQDLLRDAGVVVLVVIGLSLLWPRFGDLLGATVRPDPGPRRRSGQQRNRARAGARVAVRAVRRAGAGDHRRGRGVASGQLRGARSPVPNLSPPDPAPSSN